MIKRSTYLDILIKSKNTDYVKLLLGVRRCRKSTLIKMMSEYLLNIGVDKDHTIFINFESMDNFYLKDGFELHSYIASLIKDNKKYYLFIDEVQEIDNWLCYKLTKSNF